MNETELCIGNCLGCPNVIDSIAADEALTNASREIRKCVIDEKLDTVDAPALFQILQELGITAQNLDDELTPSSPEDVARGLRMSASRLLEHIDVQSEANAQSVSQITEGCLGPLKMRAKKAGRTVIVTVCNSPNTPDGRTTDRVDVDRSWD